MRPRGKCAAAAPPEERAAGAAGAGSPRAAENSVSIVASKKKTKGSAPFRASAIFPAPPACPRTVFSAPPCPACGSLRRIGAGRLIF
nr:hypothetical protein [Bacillaceae bacterium]